MVLTMFKYVFVVAAFVLLVEGQPVFPEDIAEAAKKDNWEQFRKLLTLSDSYSGLQSKWPPLLEGSVESLKPSDGTHVYGHSISTFKQWSNDNGNISQDGKGIEIENNDGVVSKHKFKF